MSNQAERDRFFKSRQHDRTDVEKVFGPRSDARLAQRMYTENKAYYESLRAQAQADGIIDAPREHPWAAMVRAQEAKAAGRVYSDSEIAAMSEFDEATCQRYFRDANPNGSRDNVGEMQKNDPQKYDRLRLSAVARGILPPTPNAIQRPVQRPPEPVSDGRFKLADALADRVNLPRGTRVSADQLDSIIKIIVEKTDSAAGPQDNAPASGDNKSE